VSRLAGALLLCLLAPTPAGAVERRGACASEQVVRSRLTATRLEKLFAPSAEDAEATRKEMLDKIQLEGGVKIAASIEGRFPEPGCFATVWLGSSLELHVLLAGANRELRAMGPLGQSPNSVAGAIYQESTTFEPREAVDLDGDGVDEVLERSELEVHGYDHRRLTVYGIAGAEIREALQLTTHFDDEAGHVRNEVTRFDAKVAPGAATPDGKRPIVVDGRVRYGRGVRDRHLDASAIVGHAVYRLESGRFRRSAQ
jgi:hypothetical protein